MSKMNLVLSAEELCSPLAKQQLITSYKKMHIPWQETNAYLEKIKKKLQKNKLAQIDFDVVKQLLQKDLVTFRDQINTHYKENYRNLISELAKDVNDSNKQDLINLYNQDSSAGFMKNFGTQFPDEKIFVPSGQPIPDSDIAVIRNIRGNEQLISHRLKSELPFWFVDSGYTNFLTGKKQWHRLVKDHIHVEPPPTYFPADRLNQFTCLPQPWRQENHRDPILVIENSAAHYELFDKTLDDWKSMVRLQIEKHSDRFIEFRPKNLDRKTRSNLYEHLCNNNYHCVVTDASAAAIEAIWAGIPVIVLNKHISLPVARNTVAKVNDLYRGPIGDWLCALSYSQFTWREISDGTALKILQRYHHA